MIFAGYMGAVSVVTTVKWFWFLIGIAVFVPVLYTSESPHQPCKNDPFSAWKTGLLARVSHIGRV
jgi:bacteriorhodopsin